MVDIEFKYNEFFMWFVTHVAGGDTGNVSTQKKECIVEPPILYTPENSHRKKQPWISWNWSQLCSEFVPIRQDLHQP